MRNYDKELRELNRKLYRHERMEPLAAGIFALKVYKSNDIREDDAIKRAKDSIKLAKILINELDQDTEQFRKEMNEAQDKLYKEQEQNNGQS